MDDPSYKAPRRRSYRWVGVTFVVAGALLSISSIYRNWPGHSSSRWLQFNVRDLARFDFDQINGTVADVPEKLLSLDGRRITLIGQPWSVHSRADGGVTDFQLTNYDREDYGKPPFVQKFVDCTAHPEVDFTADTIRVTRVLHVHVLRAPGDEENPIALPT